MLTPLLLLGLASHVLAQSCPAGQTVWWTAPERFRTEAGEPYALLVSGGQDRPNGVVVYFYQWLTGPVGTPTLECEYIRATGQSVTGSICPPMEWQCTDATDLPDPPKPDPKPDPSDPKDPTPEPKPDPKPDPTPDPTEPEPKPDPKPDPVPEPKPDPLDPDLQVRRDVCKGYLDALGKVCTHLGRATAVAGIVCPNKAQAVAFAAIRGLITARYDGVANDVEINDVALGLATGAMAVAFAPQAASLAAFCTLVAASNEVAEYCQIGTTVVDCKGLVTRDVYNPRFKHVKRDNNNCTNYLNTYSDLSFCPETVPWQEISCPAKADLLKIGMEEANADKFLGICGSAMETAEVPKSACSMYNAVVASEPVCGDEYVSPCTGKCGDKKPIVGTPVEPPSKDPNPGGDVRPSDKIAAGASGTRTSTGTKTTTGANGAASSGAGKLAPWSVFTVLASLVFWAV